MSKRYIVTLGNSGNIKNSIEGSGSSLNMDLKFNGIEENMNRDLEISINNKYIARSEIISKISCGELSSNNNEIINGDQKI